jgi:predicted nucleic acid-binding protein
MIILDTNVVSGLMQSAPVRSVLEWFARQVWDDLFTTAITEAEILYGIKRLPGGRKRVSLEADAEQLFRADFAERVLPFDSSAAREFAELMAESRRVGRSMQQFDGQIAAISRSRGAALATRNTAHFDGCGIVIVNPWVA